MKDIIEKDFIGFFWKSSQIKLTIIIFACVFSSSIRQITSSVRNGENVNPTSINIAKSPSNFEPILLQR